MKRKSDDFQSFAMYMSKRTMLYASLGHQRYEHNPSRTAFGVGVAHAF